MKSSYFVALVVTLALLVPTSLAVICSSFTTPDSCNGTYTDVGLCAWDATTKACFATDVPLPPGRVGITAIPSYTDPDYPPVIVDPPPLIQEPPSPTTTVPDKTSPPLSPVTPVATPQWNEVNLDNTQAASPITAEVQKLLSTPITPLCIYKRDPDVWAIYSTTTGSGQAGYVLASTSCSVSMTAGDDKEETSCMFFLMDFDGNNNSGQSVPGFAGSADGTEGSTGDAIVGVSEPMPVPDESSGVVSMSVQPDSTSITSLNNNNSYSLISVSAAEELCTVGPTEEEPMIGGDDLLLIEPVIDDGAERGEGDEDAIVEEVASSRQSSSGSGVVAGGVMMMMMVAGVGMLV